MPRGRAAHRLWSLPQLPETDHIPLGPREPLRAAKFLRVTKTQNRVLRDPEGGLHGVYSTHVLVRRRSALVEGPHFRTDASTLTEKGDEREQNTS